MKIHWEPQPKQSVALARTEDEILFGGARGGGKTDCGQAWLLYDIAHPLYRALVIREHAKDLQDWIDRAQRMFAPAGAIFSKDSFVFPSGAKIVTGHLKDDNAYTKYQGQQYQKMVIEELTHIPTEGLYEKLLASCRSIVPEIKPQVFASTNPDGPGFRWVKNRWNIPDYPEQEKIYRSVDSKNQRTRVFIPSKLEDNIHLMKSDPAYVRYLESIQDDDLREAWRNGVWTGITLKGAYYRTQLARARNEGRIGNVPYDAELPVYTWWDIGVGDSTAIGFFQNIGREWRMIDYHEATGEGLPYYVDVLKDKGYKYASHYAPHDIRVREFSSGRSRIEQAADLGIRFDIAPDISIEDGINAVRSRFDELWIDENKCKIFVDAVSQYQKEWNDKMGDYKNTPLHDWTSHAADMLRYWAVSGDIRQSSRLSEKEVLANVTSKYHSGVATAIGVSLSGSPRYVAGDQDGLFFCRECPEGADPWLELTNLLTRWSTAYCVCDSGTDSVGLRQAQEKFPGRIFSAFHAQDSKSQEIHQWGNGDQYGSVIISRHSALGQVSDELRAGLLPLYGSEEEWRQFAKEWANLRREHIDTPTGIKFKFINNAPAPYADAVVHFRVCLERFGNQKGAVASPNPLTSIPNGFMDTGQGYPLAFSNE